MRWFVALDAVQRSQKRALKQHSNTATHQHHNQHKTRSEKRKTDLHADGVRVTMLRRARQSVKEIAHTPRNTHVAMERAAPMCEYDCTSSNNTVKTCKTERKAYCLASCLARYRRTANTPSAQPEARRPVCIYSHTTNSVKKQTTTQIKCEKKSKVTKCSSTMHSLAPIFAAAACASLMRCLRYSRCGSGSQSGCCEGRRLQSH